MTTKRTILDPTISEHPGQLSFTGPDQMLHIYATHDGSFLLHTRTQPKHVSGVRLTADDLRALAAALVRLAEHGAAAP
jgi:hypothetical protein